MRRKLQDKLGHARVDLGDPFLEILVGLLVGVLWLLGSWVTGWVSSEPEQSSYQTLPPGVVIIQAARARTVSGPPEVFNQ